MLPEIEAGVGVVYIPCETWSYERNHTGIPPYERLWEIDTISDLPALYNKLK